MGIKGGTNSPFRCSSSLVLVSARSNCIRVRSCSDWSGHERTRAKSRAKNNWLDRIGFIPKRICSQFPHGFIFLIRISSQSVRCAKLYSPHSRHHQSFPNKSIIWANFFNKMGSFVVESMACFKLVNFVPYSDNGCCSILSVCNHF